MSSDLEQEAGEIRLEERLTAPLALALARLLREAEEASAGPCRQKTILDGARQLWLARRDGHEAEWVRDADWKPPRKSRGCGRTKARDARPLPQERELTESVSENLYLAQRKGTRPTGNAQNSNPLQALSPDQANFQTSSEGGLVESRDLAGTAINLAEARPIKLNQTESNQIKPLAAGACPEIGQPDGERGRWQAPGQTRSNPVKPDQVQSSPIKSNQTKSNLLAGLSSPSLRRRLRGKVLWLCYFLGLARIKPDQDDQDGSNQIKPNQTCLLVCAPPPYVRGYARRCCGCATFALYQGYFLGLANQGGARRIKPNQTCEGVRRYLLRSPRIPK